MAPLYPPGVHEPITASTPGPPTDGLVTLEELALATRNRGMPLEAMRYDVTPTGLHYLLIHFDIPFVDPSTWTLSVGGATERAFRLTLDEVRALPASTIPVTMECAGNGRARLSPRPLSQPWLHEAIGTAEWTGAPLHLVLEQAGLRDDALEVVFTGADRGIQGEKEQDYARSLPVADAIRAEVLLAYEMNGRALEPQHGFPLRLLVPGWYGMTSVKWLTGIEVVTEPFEGYQQHEAYRFQRDDDEVGDPVSRIQVRALMIPPGIPDFFTRVRVVDAGRIEVRGRAWAGGGGVARVEFGVDGEWRDAMLDPPLGEFAWRGWSCAWNATPGEHELSCRATTTDGDVQPLTQPWNVQGVANNHVQIVRVTVR